MFAGFTQRLNFGMGGGTVSVPSAFPTRPIGQLGNFNTYAINFISATGITASDQQSAINQLSYDLVNTGLMDKMIAIYPFVGGNATAHSFNLKDPRDTNAAFRLTFVGGATHSSTGYFPSISNGYANTFLNPVFNLPNPYLHLSTYIRTIITPTNTRIDVAQSNNTNTFCQINGGANFYAGNGTIGQGGVSFTTTTTSQGHWIGVKSSDSVRFGFRNGVLNSTPTSTNDTTAYLSANFYIGARNNSGTAAFFAGKETAFVTIGIALTQAECATLYTIIQNFQTTLGRQV